MFFCVLKHSVSLPGAPIAMAMPLYFLFIDSLSLREYLYLSKFPFLCPVFFARVADHLTLGDVEAYVDHL